jgi:O-antigen/teichoic acid export membrane protein
MIFLGFGFSVHYFTSTGRHDPKDSIATYLAVGFLLGTVLAGVLTTLYQFDALGKTARDIPPLLFYASLIPLPLMGCLTILDRFIIGTSWFSLYNTISIGKIILRCVLLLICVGLLGTGLAGCVISILLTNLIMLLFIITVFWQRYRPRMTLHMRFVREGFGYGIRAYFGQLAVQANLRVDQFILGISASPSALGIYSVAVAMSEIINSIKVPVNIVLFNLISASRSESERRRLTRQVHRAMFIMTLLASLIAAVLGSWIIPLILGDNYASVTLPFLLLLPGVLLMVTPSTITKYLSGSGKVGTSSIIHVVGMIIGIVLYLIFIPMYECVGAAIACSLNYIAVAVTSIILYRRIIQPEPTGLFAFHWHDYNWISTQILSGLKRKNANIVATGAGTGK